MCTAAAAVASSSSCWSELHHDLVAEIFSCLELVDFIRAAAVCKSWRQLKSKSKPKNQIPWLMLSSLSPYRIQYRYFYTLSASDDNKKCRYKIHLPEIAGYRCIGSSEGFLIALDKFANLSAVNPIMGTHIPLPPTSTAPDVRGVVRDPTTGEITAYLVEDCNHPLWTPSCHRLKDMRALCFGKAILSPATTGPRPRMVVTLRMAWGLAFACVGDDRWHKINASPSSRNVQDIVFHRGRLHAVWKGGALAIYDLGSSGSHTLVCWSGGSLPPDELVWDDRCYLVESPDGSDLFLVRRHLDLSYTYVKNTTEEWEYEYGDADAIDNHRYKDMNVHPITRTTSFLVFKLDRTGRQWIRVNCLGDLALFLGLNRSMALSARDFPTLKRNCVYFTDDSFGIILHHRPRAIRDMGVFDMGDASVKPLNLSDDVLHLKWPPPIWLTPHLS